MGQTLSNGVYLPNEGERNCYAGLASNWQILNTAVGNIAEKAPLVHTHGNLTNDGKVGTTANKPLITGTGGAVQAGSFGTSANTFCEGNDSRLSDARTPVAHTHTKSDVTDLLNSNFIPSANNTYDLGSSSYQWNNLYAKNYYYNGTAWGLDKQNEWTNFQRMTSNPAVWYLRNNTVTLGTTPSSNRYIGMFFEDVNGADIGYAAFQANKNSYNSIMLSLRNSDGTNAYTGALRYRASTTGAYCFFPETGECDLGISTNKWKSFNGVNPGALSLPNYSDTTYIDISGSIVPPTGETEINKNLGDNQYTPPIDGWLSIRCDGAKYLQIYRNSYNCPGVTSSDGVGAKLVVTLPVRKNVTYTIRIKKDSAGTEYYQLYPCQGNV